MCEIEFIYYVSTIVVNTLIISGFVWVILGLFRARDYERKIDKLHNELNAKIKKEKERRASMETINLKIEHLREEYRSKIEELKRKRQFVLDKLPFFK